MTPFEVREIVRRLAAAYPDPPLGDESADLYARMLVDLPYDTVDEVVDELIATAMKLPTVSRIRRAVVEPTLDIPTADEAWLAVQTRTGDCTSWSRTSRGSSEAPTTSARRPTRSSRASASSRSTTSSAAKRSTARWPKAFARSA